jgi:hypothetical protein
MISIYNLYVMSKEDHMDLITTIYQQFWNEPSDNPAPSIPHSCALPGDLAGAGSRLADGWLQRSAPTGEAPGGSISKPTKLDLYVLVVF